MKTTFRQCAVKGFTLIELLIVVIIIAIMAAIAIPQFSNSTDEARDAALDANLNAVRSAIELYRVQHNNTLPSTAAASGGTCTGGTAGTGAANSGQAFRDQLTMHSNRAGQTCSVQAPGFDYGPYLRAIPRDIFTAPVSGDTEDTGDDVAVTNGALAELANGTVGAGWRFSNTTGRFEMNNATLDQNERPYSAR